MKTRKKRTLPILILAVLICFSLMPAAGVAAMDWTEFQGNANHNGVIATETPIKADDAALYWATKVQADQGWLSAPSHPMIIDDMIVFFANRTIYKMDKTSGEILQEGSLAAVSSWNITMPTYGDGRIYVCLANGRIQAINFETLESEWVYQNSLKGQSNCPISYYDGLVYSGYWNSPNKNAAFVCVDAETGEEVWALSHPGGFYWAGCYVCDDYLLVGSDDGSGGDDEVIEEPQGSGVLYSLDPKTGEVIDTIDNVYGDIRSTVAMADNVAYFTSRGGYFYGVPVKADGSFDKDNITKINLGNASASTPTIYKGRAYVGVMGDAGQFQHFGGHNIAVIALASKKIAYRCPTAGFCQTSGILTTAYEEDGSVYVYFIDNYTPGKLRVIKDKPGQTAMDAAGPYADVLFTPANAQEEYALCSPIVDEDGTMYFKNDSGYIMALGWNIKEIKVTQMPAKTTYRAGESFDPADMRVTATLVNGKTRDVTDYVTYGTEPLATDDLDVTISYSHLLYHDVDDEDNSNDNNLTNQAIAPLYTSVPVKVTSGNPFVDVKSDAFYYDAVLWALENDITQGTDKTHFSPAQTCTRSQVVTFLWRAAGRPEPTQTANPFKDVNSKDYFYKAVLWAVENNITAGTSKTTFGPNAGCTRGQVATFLYRAAGSPAVSGSNPFVDVKAGEFYYNAVLWAVANNITKGTNATHFSPNTTCNRGQIVTFLYRAQ